MKPETKAKIEKASKELDTVTDGLLFKVSQTKYSWAVLGATHLIAFILGAWAF